MPDTITLTSTISVNLFCVSIDAVVARIKVDDTHGALSVNPDAPNTPRAATSKDKSWEKFIIMIVEVQMKYRSFVGLLLTRRRLKSR